MGVRIIPEETQRRRYPDGTIKGNWGDVFVVLSFTALFVGAIVALIVHFCKSQ